MADNLISKNYDWMIGGDFNVDLLSKKIKGLLLRSVVFLLEIPCHN